MIDWYLVGFGALWIFGSGLVVSALSYATYLGEQKNLRFGQVYKSPDIQVLINLGLLFICMGWTGSVSNILGRIAWAILALIFGVQTWQTTKKNRRMKPSPDTGVKTQTEEAYYGNSIFRGWGAGKWQVWVGIVFSLVFLGLALRGVDLLQMVTALSRVNVFILALGVASYVGSAAAKAVRWQLLLGGRQVPPFTRVFSILSIGLMVNAFLPARLGEFARAYLLGEAEADSKVYILGTIAVEKVTDLLSLLLLLALLLIQMPLPAWLADPARGMALVLVFLVPCFILVVWQKDFVLRLVELASRFLPLAWREWLVQQTYNGLDSLKVMRRPRILFGLFCWSMIVWMVSALTNYLIFLALKITIPILASLLLLAVLQVGTTVPSSPGRIGVFQYLVILTLSIFTLDKNLALGYSVALYLVIYVPIALLGVWGLWYEKITWGKLTEALIGLSEGRKIG
jgi:uncharacterized protein (TIRG00374 family)